MFSPRLARTALLAAFPLALESARADVILVQDLVQQGRATVTASQWDIGHKDALFNRNWDDVYRSASVNPAVITVEFDAPTATGAARMLAFASPNEITLEAADTLADLDARTGTYVEIFAGFRVEDGQVGWREWNDTPVTRRIYRFSVRRLERDDFVHIRELELQTPEPVQEVLIDGDLVRINVIEILPQGSEVPVGDSVQLSTEASLSYGPDRYDVNDIAVWGSSGAAASVDQTGLATGVSAGASTISASIGVVEGRTELSVRDRRQADLDVGFIDRSPDYDRFRVDYSDGDQVIQAGFETQQKWPDPGELVTYTAHVFNRGDDPVTDVDFEWRFDGVVVDTGTIPVMNPNERVQIQYSAPWPADTVQVVDIDPGAHTFEPIQYERAVGDHTIELTLDPDDRIAESSELNNTLRDYINAVQFHFYMEQHTYDRFLRHRNFLETFSPENWAQLQLEALQRKLWVSGGRQRVRLDTLEVVPDGTLDPGGTHEPIGQITWTTDGVWGFDWPPFYMDWFLKRVDQALVHELGHQIGLIDVYQYDIATDNCLITSSGTPVAGTALMPKVSPWNVYYGRLSVLHRDGVALTHDTDRGAMANTRARFFGSGTIAGLNRNLGLRRGFYGDYLGALPAGPYTLEVTHTDGAPLQFAAVRVFQREMDAKIYDIPKFTGLLNADGRWTFPGVTEPGWKGGIPVVNPWSSVIDGQTFNAPHPIGANAVLVIELVFLDGAELVTEYHFFEPDDVNVAFNQGQTDAYTIRLRTYASRAANTLPSISFSTPDRVSLDEGQTLEVTVSASDPDGDPVTLAATPLPNATFDPASGRFTFEPDSLQVTRHNGQNEAHIVTFTADDGSFQSARTLFITVDDVPGYAKINDVTADPCPVDFNDDGVLNFFDVSAFLALFAADDPAADLNDDGVLNFFDVSAFLTQFNDGCA